MGAWTLIQVVFDIFAALGFFVIIMRMNRAPKDDPRLSRGLQLLQSKIAVLEDLSDRTEAQVGQLTAILEQKTREVQAKVQLAEQHVHAIRVSMDRSLEVAKIFQDKIPHQEIIERQNTIKYVQAARLAHQGLTVEEIATQVDLPKGEIEFIAKVNRDQLVFDEEHLPPWAKNGAAIAELGELRANIVPPSSTSGANDGGNYSSGSSPEGYSGNSYAGASGGTTAGSAGSFGDAFGNSAASENAATVHADQQAARLRAEIELAERQRLVENLSRLQSEMQSLDVQLARESGVRDLSSAFETPKVENSSLQKLGEEFRKACDAANAEPARHPLFPPLEQLANLIPQSFIGEEEQAIPSVAQPVPMSVSAMNAQAAAAGASAALGAGAGAGMQSSSTPIQQMSMQASAHALAQAQSAPIVPPGSNTSAQAQSQSQTQAQGASQAQELRDPALLKAAAAARVQAALRSGAKTTLPTPEASAELTAARLMAKEAAAPQSVHLVTSRGSQQSTAVIRKVEFPKIDSPGN